jgi:uncharacterized protein (TIGR00369 family)
MSSKPSGHGHWLGMVYHAHGDGWCELALPYDPRLVGDEATGILASGPILSLMDTASAASMHITLGEFRSSATLDLRIDYLRPARVGATVIGRGECYRVTRAIAFVRGYAHDGDPDDPLANVAATFMFTDAKL